MYSGKVIGSLGFSRRGVFIGEEAAAEVGQGGLTTRGRGPALGHAYGLGMFSKFKHIHIHIHLHIHAHTWLKRIDMILISIRILVA
jgi:hypothetical protein